MMKRCLSRQLAGLRLRQSLARPAACRIPSRLYSESANAPKESPEPEQTKPVEENSEKISASEASSSNDGAAAVPWYLRVNEDFTQLNPALSEPIPDTPANSPESLAKITEFMVRELGFMDVKFIDLRNRSPVTIWGPDAILVLASGNTDRHIGRGTHSLMTFIKKNYDVVPKQEGIQTSGFLKLQHRRLKKKAKKMANSDETFDYAAEATRFANNWVVLDTKLGGVTVHMMTKEKREEIDLELVWAEDRKAFAEARREARAKAEAEAEAENDSFASNSNSSSEYGSQSPFSFNGQVRGFHSTSRVLSSFSRRFAEPNSTPPPPPPSNTFKTPNQKVLNQLKEYSLKGDFANAKEISRPTSYTFEEDAQHTQLVLKAHINHLTNLKNTPAAEELTADSAVVASFFSSFPFDPSMVDWRLRLIFIQHAHAINYKAFPMDIIEENIIMQQASGFPVDTWDVELVVNTIVNSKQFSDRPKLDASDKKSQYIYSIVKNCLRPQGISLARSNVFHMLLYRLWIADPELTAAAATADPTPKRDETTGELLVQRPLVLNSKSLSVYHYLLESGQEITKPFLILSLSAFANDNKWDEFWTLWARIAEDKTVDSELFNTMAALVVKSGYSTAISHLVDQVLPDTLMADQTLGTPELGSILNIALDCLDPSGTGYLHVREEIKNFA